MSHLRGYGWTGPLVMVFLMTVLAACTSFGLTQAFSSSGSADPSGATAGLANVWNTLLYIPLLAALVYFVRGEGARIGDLVGFDRGRLGRDVLIGIGLALLFLVADGVLEFGVAQAVFAAFGEPSGAPGSVPRLSVTAIFFGLLLLPLGAGIIEELVYRGYALPRLAKLSNRWTGLLIVSVGFGLQHVGLAISGSWRFALVRGISLTVVGIIMGLIYFKQKRLMPLMVGHVVWDFLGIGLLSGLLPILTAS